MLDDRTEARSFAEWQRAPRDGSLINVEFLNGEIRQARWDAATRRWQLPRSDGSLVTMDHEPGCPPLDWWPAF